MKLSSIGLGTLLFVIGIGSYSLGISHGQREEQAIAAQTPRVLIVVSNLDQFALDYEKIIRLISDSPEVDPTACGRLEDALRAVGWVEELIPTMKAISHAESGCRPDALYKTLYERSVGPLQINTRAHPWVTDWCAKDLFCSSRAALQIYHGPQGLRAWTSYRGGIYRRYLQPVR